MSFTTGAKFPGAGASVVRGAGNTAWTGTTNLAANDGANASCNTVPSDYLVLSSFGFTIPPEATILGVTVTVEASETGSGSSSYIPQLISNTTPTLIGAAKSAVTVTTGPVTTASGGAADLWSATLTPAVVNASGFGVAIWSTDTTNVLLLDYVTIEVTYDIWPVSPVMAPHAPPGKPSL